MLTARYLPSTRNLDAILDKIIGGVAPDKFTVDHLRAVGFASSNDRAVIPLLKDLGFLAPDGAPTPRYHAFRDRSKSKAVMAEALREAYEDVFHVSETPTPSDRAAVEGLFKSKLNSSDKVAQVQAMTFYALLSRADLKAEIPSQGLPEQVRRTDAETADAEDDASSIATSPTVPTGPRMGTELHYTIQVHLPATKDLEVYNAIFRSLRENLLA